MCSSRCFSCPVGGSGVVVVPVLTHSRRPAVDVFLSANQKRLSTSAANFLFTALSTVAKADALDAGGGSAERRRRRLSQTQGDAAAVPQRILGVVDKVAASLFSKLDVPDEDPIVVASSPSSSGGGAAAAADGMSLLVQLDAVSSSLSTPAAAASQSRLAVSGLAASPQSPSRFLPLPREAMAALAAGAAAAGGVVRTQFLTTGAFDPYPGAAGPGGGVSGGGGITRLRFTTTTAAASSSGIGGASNATAAAAEAEREVSVRGLSAPIRFMVPNPAAADLGEKGIEEARAECRFYVESSGAGGETSSSEEVEANASPAAAAAGGAFRTDGCVSLPGALLPQDHIVEWVEDELAAAAAAAAGGNSGGVANTTAAGASAPPASSPPPPPPPDMLLARIAASWTLRGPLMEGCTRTVLDCTTGGSGPTAAARRRVFLVPEAPLSAPSVSCPDAPPRAAGASKQQNGAYLVVFQGAPPRVCSARCSLMLMHAPSCCCAARQPGRRATNSLFSSPCLLQFAIDVVAQFCLAGARCALWNPHNSPSCFFNASSQVFEGVGCMPPPAVSCGCLHLTGAKQTNVSLLSARHA